MLINSKSKINAINPTYTAKLGLKVQQIDVGIEKIVVSSAEIYGMVIAISQILDQFDYLYFFQKIFLFADIIIKIMFNMRFLTFSNADV